MRKAERKKQFVSQVSSSSSIVRTYVYCVYDDCAKQRNGQSEVRSLDQYIRKNEEEKGGDTDQEEDETKKEIEIVSRDTTHVRTHHCICCVNVHVYDGGPDRQTAAVATSQFRPQLEALQINREKRTNYRTAR